MAIKLPCDIKGQKPAVLFRPGEIKVPKYRWTIVLFGSIANYAP